MTKEDLWEAFCFGWDDYCNQPIDPELANPLNFSEELQRSYSAGWDHASTSQRQAFETWYDYCGQFLLPGAAW